MTVPSWMIISSAPLPNFDKSSTTGNDGVSTILGFKEPDCRPVMQWYQHQRHRNQWLPALKAPKLKMVMPSSPAAASTLIPMELLPVLRPRAGRSCRCLLGRGGRIGRAADCNKYCLRCRSSCDEPGVVYKKGRHVRKEGRERPCT